MTEPGGSSPVVAYCRISRDREGAGLGVERQAADCRELAARLGLPEPEVIPDNDLSAYSGKRRPGYERLLEGLRAGRWTTLLAWHVDRLTRRPRELEDLVDALNGPDKIAVHMVKGGEIDLSTAEGRLHAGIMGQLARYESEHRSDRVRRKLADNAAKGRPHGGPRVYGFEADGITVRPAEAAVVAELVRRIVDGESVRGLARELRQRGVPSRFDAAWDASVVRRLVLRPRVAGLVEHRGRIVTDEHGEPVKAVWPPLVDRDLWETARAILTDPARRTSPGNTPTRLLSGIATCWCGERVVAGGQREGVAVYRCSAHEHLKRRVNLVDPVVVAHVLAHLRKQEVTTRHGPAAPVPDMREKANVVRLRIEQVEDALVGDPTEELAQISPAGLRRNLVRLQKQLVDLERQDALTRRPGTLEGVTAENFEALPLERRRAVVAELVQVRLLKSRPGPFDSATVNVRLRPEYRMDA